MKLKLHDNPYVPLYKRVSFLYIPVLFVVVSVLLEVIMFSIMQFAFPVGYIFSLAILLIFAIIVALIPQKWLQTVVCSLLIGCQLFTTISNITAYQTCNEIFSLETLKTISTAFANAGSVVLDLTFLIPIISLLVVYIASLVLIMWFCRTPKGFRYQFQVRSIFCGILAFMSLFSYTMVYSGLPNYKNSRYVNLAQNQKFIYDSFSNRIITLQTFGSYSFYLDNLLALMGGKVDTLDLIDVELNETFTPNTFALDESEVLGEGYNLITILMETFEREAINPVTMPNLTKFLHESCVDVNGYYSVERTCFTDYISQTGMHPAGKEYWNNYGDVAAPQSLANIFSRSGYATEAFHNWHGNCYNRYGVFEKLLGFDHFNDYSTYTNTYYPQHCALNPDELLFANNIERIAPAGKNFYSYVITGSTHAVGPFRFDFPSYYPDEFAYVEEASNWEELTEIYPVLLSKDKNVVTRAKNYLVATYSFDLGFGALLNYLKNTDDELHPGKKLIETTALVMFGDHYYYTNPDFLKPESEDPRELAGNRSPFIVYNPRQIVDKVSGATQGDNAVKTEPEKCGYTLNRFTSTMDIYPTVCSLFGVKTDQQLTYGRSIFDDAPSVGVAYLTGYTWGAVGYQTSTNRIDMITGEPFVEWQIWKTLDFIHYIGVDLSQEQLDAIAPTVNRVYDSIFLNSKLFESDGFVKLEKAKYQLGKSNLI